MVLVRCVSSFGALNSPKVMLPVNMLRKQNCFSSDHPPERLLVIHLYKGLVIPRELLDPPHLWECAHHFQVNFAASVMPFSLPAPESSGNRSLDAPCSLSKWQEQDASWQMGCSE